VRVSFLAVPKVLLTVLLVVAVGLGYREARAEELRVHALLGGGHAVGNPQAHEFGFGGSGSFAVEYPIGKVIGLQVELGTFILSKANPPEDPTIADHGAGTSVEGLLGLRLRPFGAKKVAGLWLDANGGFDRTGSLNRGVFDGHVGYDWRLKGAGRWDLGPYVGYTQVFQPGNTLRPNDAHILWLGVHVALGARGERVRPDRDKDTIFDDEDACPDAFGIRTSDPKTNGCPDRDKDGVFDKEDACPDEPGVRTDDPKTNGCPRADRDHDTVYDDEDACPDVPGVRTADPKTNGCPRGDRDKDGVFDDEDACPDVPGVRTSDAKTNGCPPATDQVHVEGDQILLDDIIHFDTGSPRVRRVSWAIVKKVAEFIIQTPDIMEINIEGHADDVGTSEYNMYLSNERALSVKAMLVKYGVDASKLTTHAYGKTRPRVEGHAETQRRENRRVEFTITRARKGQVND
jgi:outer membrane protein OmpA-like peptidoglycan-associated protein